MLMLDATTIQEERFPKIRGTILGVPSISMKRFWCLHWGHLLLGNYQMLGVDRRTDFVRRSSGHIRENDRGKKCGAMMEN